MSNLLLLYIACVSLWAIISPRVPTGVLGTTGLTFIACGCLAELDPNSYVHLHLRTYGLALVCTSMAWRYAGRDWWIKWSEGHIQRAERLAGRTNRRT